MKTPAFNPTVLISDSPELAAQLSAALSMKGTYLALIDSPRLTRSDAHAEVIRRTNAISTTQVSKVVIAGGSDEVVASFNGRIPPSFVKRVDTLTDASLAPAGIRLKQGAPIRTRRDCIGPGLLQALRAKCQLEFDDEAAPVRYVPPSSAHMVVCEDEDRLSQVIAANYAFAIGAGLQLIPSPTEPFVDEVNERFYSAASDEFGSTTNKLEYLALHLRQYLKGLNLAGVQSMTFITSGVPWGFAVQEMPTTHLFVYPDLGISIIHGLAGSMNQGRPLRLIAMVDPGQVQSQEVVMANRCLIERGPVVMAFRNNLANVRSVSHMLDLVPYDLLFIATHCGDVKGRRETYRFLDSSGKERTLVLDMAMQATPGLSDEKVEVKQYQRFISIDGVPWQNKEERMRTVGSALLDFYAEGAGDRTPASFEAVGRVVGSAALVMADGNLLATPMNAGANSFPIIFNNACVSWHELASRFMFGGSRAYIGTLIEVSDSEAQAVAMGVLDKYFGRPLAHALWSTQKEVSGGGIRRPYIMVGVYTQRLRSTLESPHQHILDRLNEARSYWREQLGKTPAQKAHARLQLADRIEFLERCIDDFTSDRFVSM